VRGSTAAKSKPTRANRTSRVAQPAREEALELTILMPCLNEAESVAQCIQAAQRFLDRSGVSGEILVADNGSTDGSAELAARAGARVIHVEKRGYGSALLEGIRQARGKYVITGDSDGSYDFDNLEPFVDKLRENVDLVVGDRFRGGIAPRAMPVLHRYFGNPFLSFLGRLFFPPGVRDFHCGLRGFNREAILALDLKMQGMEFASEMVVRASLARLTIAELPTTLSPAGRSRPPHLRTWRDGWLNLRFLLLFSPSWLFLYPGIAILCFGLIVTTLLLPGPVAVSPHVTLDIHTFIVGCIALLVGTQFISFAVLSRRYATSRGFLPPPVHASRYELLHNLEAMLIVAALILVGGLGGIAYSFFSWAAIDFGPMQYPALLRVLTISCTLVALAMQIGLTGFLLALFGIDD
jgi:hypothetical protein